MKNIYVGMIGLFGGMLTTVSFIPQIIKIIKTKHTKDISLYMYVVLTTGILFWLTYGILLGEYPIIIANSVSLFLCSFVIIMKLKYK